MAIYDTGGNELSLAYDVNGNTLSDAYDIEGSSVFSDEPYPITNVVDYFRAETLSVASEVNALSNDWQSFVFITDPHGDSNEQHSQAIGLYLLDNTPVSMIVLGGDYSINVWDKTQYSRYVQPFVSSNAISKIYALFGNHETYGGGTTEAKQSIYTDFLSAKRNITGDLSNIYYYFDAVGKKTRFMFLNTSDGSGQYDMSNAQISWITQNAALPSSEWSLVVIGHVNLDNMGFTTMNENNAFSIISAINQCNGNIVGYFCGHQHIDAISDTGNFYQATLYCDKLETTNWYSGYSITDRSAGNTTEQAVSVISFNTKTGDVVIRRVGVGKARSLTYNYKS